MMEEEAAGQLGADLMLPDLGRVQTAARHQLNLINDILDLAKIEAGKMTAFAEDFEIAPLVREVETVVQPLVTKNANRLVVDCPADLGRMHTDQTKLRQILFNLLSNACKFTENGTVRLQVSVPEAATPSTVAAAPTVRFQVTDTGIGMSSDQLAKLFQAFSQADASTSKKYGGTGLGLALSKKFCQILGGDLTVQSEFRRGSTFTVLVPRAIPAADHTTS